MRKSFNPRMYLEYVLKMKQVFKSNLDGDLLDVLPDGDGDLDPDRDFVFFFVLCSARLSLFSLGAVEYPVSLFWLLYLAVVSYVAVHGVEPLLTRCAGRSRRLLYGPFL